VRKTIASLFIIIFIFCAAAHAQRPVRSNAPDFKLKDAFGSEVSLEGFRGKSAVLLLFWATWCPYCKEELKGIEDRYKELEKEGVKLLAVDVGEPPNAVTSFLSRRGLNFTVLMDKDMTVTDSYGIIGVPFFVLIDKEGIIRFANSYFPEKEYKELLRQ